MVGNSCSTSNAKHQSFYACSGTGGKGSSEPSRVPKQFLSLASSAMELLSYQNRDTSLNVEGGWGNEKPSIASSRQMDCIQLSNDHFNLLPSKNLPTIPRPLLAIPPNMAESVALAHTCSNTGKRSSNFQADDADVYPLPDNRPVKLLKWSSSYRACSREPIVSKVNSDATSTYSKALSAVGNNDHVENFLVPRIGYSVLTEGESTSLCQKNENPILSKSQVAVEEKSSADGYDAAAHSRAMIPSEEKDQATISNRIRRAKISEGIKALQKSVPSAKGNKESVLDDVIDYIKFLKFQLKVLSQSRLCGEPTTHAFVHVEGYGHYLLHPQMSREPFEELMGQFMELNMPAANELLNSRGLALLPMDYAYTLL